PYTAEVEVLVETVDPDASYAVSGNTDLQSGENTLTVTVTAADGEATAEYTVTLTVLLSADTSLATFTVNGNDVADGDVVELDPYTTEVDVVAEATDENAVVEVSGGTDLVAGENTLTVTVTAPNGDVAEYTLTLTVLLSADTSLATFTVNGNDVVDGDSVDLDYGTTEVEVVAEATDENATVDIAGGSELVTGENTLTVTVTAPNGDVAEYTVTLTVALNSDASLATFTVNGNDVQDGDVVELDPYTAEVEVVAEATDPDATVEISGNTDLQSGDNTLTVSVTAADGVTTAEYTVTLTVLLSADTSLATFTVNGNDVADGDVVELDPYTTEVEVEAVATDENATVEVSGGTELVAGENTLTVTVTAPNGDVAEYTVTLLVAFGNNVELSLFQVNGEDVEDGGSVDLAPLTTEVEVLVETVDLDASYVVTGDTDLQVGSNTLTVTVTAADGETTATYTVTLQVALNNDVTLSVFQVNGVDANDGDSFSFEFGTEEAQLVIQTNDPDATVSFEGAATVVLSEAANTWIASGLVSGENALTITVTAADGETTGAYAITLNVALSNITSLSAFTVNGVDVESGDVLDFEFGTTEVEVVAEATDADATVEISGNADLVSGENTLVVTVTAADGETVEEFTVTLN
ncbi:MAG: hypothetical protein EBR26_05020, partial [Microbacteriaceae bacterium]|nr:hypothetical protein [Microbacteriaceae bacterium]